MIELDPNRYHTPIEQGDNDARSLVIGLTGRDRSVLEIGTSTGYMSEIFKRMGNSVTGIEKDKSAGDSARPHCDSLIIGDIEDLDFDACLASFDVVVFADVLEHLVDPWKVLNGVKGHLKKGGYLVVSMPNVCHGDVLLGMLRGNFEYMPTGLLDITHLRFFAYKNLVELFRGCGYEIADLHTVRKPVGTTECARAEMAPDALFCFIKSLPNSDAYQFVFRAYPCDNPKSEAENKPKNEAGDDAVHDLSLMDFFDKTLGESVKEYARQMTELKSICLRHERDLVAAQEEIDASKEKLIAFQNELIALQNSAGYRLEAIFCDYLGRWLPAGTARRRAYAWLVKSCVGRSRGESTGNERK